MLTLENLAARAVPLGLVMYAIFGGADFGGGIWTALLSGPRAREQREGLFHAIGPVWETNHVWLIFVVVTLFTALSKGICRPLHRLAGSVRDRPGRHQLSRGGLCLPSFRQADR